MGAAADSAAATAAAGALAKSKSADEPKRLRSMAGVPANLNELRQQRADTEAHTSLASLRAAIAAEPARWAWQRDGGAVQDMSDAVYAWLAQLDNAAGATWRPRVARETAAPLGRELRLLHDGRVVHSLRLTERGVLWERGQSSWQAELPLATVQALEASAP